MKSTKHLSVNITRTLLIILGIVVAALLTFNSGLIGEASTLTSGFRLFTAEIDTNTQPDRIEQAKQLLIAGKGLYQEINQLLETH